MARVSFTLRRSTVDRGSYVRFDTDTYDTAASAGNSASAGTWTYAADRDSDASLRSDGYQLPPIEYVESYLEAFPVTYGTVQINWGAPLVALGQNPAPSETLLVYSPYGPAATISSGTVLSEGSTSFTYTQNELVGGQWAYYTLFVRYQSTAGDDYYEPAASVEVIVPENYKSTLLLWSRIPEYYRQQDQSIGEYIDPTSDYAVKELGCLPAGNYVGPLFKFLSIFGFEMDTTRTLIDYVMVSRDPTSANTEVLDAIARTIGVGANSALINSSRIRAILDDIGYLRRSKGTLEGIEAYGRALSGSNLSVDTANREITFYSQRVNYITDPRDANITNCTVTHRPAHECESQRLIYSQGNYDPTTYDANDEDTYPPTLDEYLPGMYWTSASASTFEGIPVDVNDYIVAYTDSAGDIAFGVSGYAFSATNYSSYSGSYTNTGASYVSQGTGASVGVTHVMFHIDCPIPVKEDDTVYFSVHSAVGTGALKWARLVDETGNIIGRSTTLTRAGDSPAAGITVEDNLSTTDEWTIGFIEFLVDLGSVTTYELSSLLAERNHIGEYFDGSSTRGGWIVDENGDTVSDYRWSYEGENNGNSYQSVSIYSEEYQRTRALLINFFASALPVTLQDYYTVVATDAIPGQSAIDTYLTTP
jgi:hypothetical protein